MNRAEIALDAENKIIGTLLMYPESVRLIRHEIDPKHFTSPRSVVVGAIFDLHDEGIGIDVSTVQNRIPAESIEKYFKGLEGDFYSPAKIETYASLVLQAWKRREARRIAEELAKLADGADAIEDIATTFAAALGALAVKDEKVSTNAALIAEKWYAKAEAGRIAIPITTGIDELDDLSGGFYRGDLVWVAAYPSVGKTVLLLDIATRVARQGLYVNFFSTETTSERLLMRYLRANAGVNPHNYKIHKLPLDEGERGRIKVATKSSELVRMEWKFCQDNVMQIQDFCLTQTHRPDIVFIDYFGDLNHNLCSGGERERYDESIRSLKRLAREVNSVVMIATQLDKRMAGMEGQEPNKRDLRGTGEIEASATQIYILSTEKNLLKEDNGITPIRKRKLNLAKNKDGVVGTLAMDLDHEKLTFTNLRQEGGGR